MFKPVTKNEVLTTESWCFERGHRLTCKRQFGNSVDYVSVLYCFSIIQHQMMKLDSNFIQFYVKM